MARRELAIAVLVWLACSPGCAGSTASPELDRSPDAIAEWARTHAPAPIAANGALVLEAKGYRVLDDGPDEKGTWTRMRAWMPQKADAPLRLEDLDDPEVFLEAYADHGTAKPSLVHGGVVLRDVAPATDAVYLGERARVEELRVLHDASAPTRVRWTLKLGPHVREVRVHGALVEVVDREGRVRIASEPIVAIDANGTRRDAGITVAGDVLELDVDTTGLVYPIVLDPAWTGVASTESPRLGHTATIYGANRVIVVGGGTIAAEIYDPASKAWSKAPTPSATHTDHTATKLGTDQVLVVGGQNTPVTELWDGGTATWVAAGNLAGPRRSHAAVLLGDGTVIVSGGFSTSETSANTTAECWNPATKTWTLAAKPTYARAHGAAVASIGGKALVVGGMVTAVRSSTAEIYDGATDTWKTAAPMAKPRLRATLTPLANGRVIVIGGDIEGTTEIYDPAADTWTLGPKLQVARDHHTTTMLGADRLLVVGGARDNVDVDDTAELYEPSTSRFLYAGRMSIRRVGHEAVVIGDAGVLVVGGRSSLATPGMRTAEVWLPLATGDRCTSGGECASGACKSEFCCAAGECDLTLQGCRSGADCPPDYTCSPGAECVKNVIASPTDAGVTPTDGGTGGARSTAKSSGCGCNCDRSCGESGWTKFWGFLGCDCCRYCHFGVGNPDSGDFVAWWFGPLILAWRRRGRAVQNTPRK